MSTRKSTYNDDKDPDSEVEFKAFGAKFFTTTAAAAATTSASASSGGPLGTSIMTHSLANATKFYISTASGRRQPWSRLNERQTFLLLSEDKQYALQPVVKADSSSSKNETTFQEGYELEMVPLRLVRWHAFIDFETDIRVVPKATTGAETSATSATSDNVAAARVKCGADQPTNIAFPVRRAVSLGWCTIVPPELSGSSGSSDASGSTPAFRPHCIGYTSFRQVGKDLKPILSGTKSELVFVPRDLPMGLTSRYTNLHDVTIRHIVAFFGDKSDGGKAGDSSTTGCNPSAGQPIQGITVIYRDQSERPFLQTFGQASKDWKCFTINAKNGQFIKAMSFVCSTAGAEGAADAAGAAALRNSFSVDTSPDHLKAIYIECSNPKEIFKTGDIKDDFVPEDHPCGQAVQQLISCDSSLRHLEAMYVPREELQSQRFEFPLNEYHTKCWCDGCRSAPSTKPKPEQKLLGMRFRCMQCVEKNANGTFKKDFSGNLICNTDYCERCLADSNHPVASKCQQEEHQFEMFIPDAVHLKSSLHDIESKIDMLTR